MTRLKSLLFLSILLNTVLIVWLIFKNNQQPDTIRYPLLDLSRNYIDQKYFLVNFTPLRDQLEKYLNAQSDYQISLYFEYLHTGSFIWLNQQLRIPPASLTKVPVAMVMYKEIEQGKRLLSDKHLLTAADKDPRWGSLHQQPEGTPLTWQQLIEASLQHSDNTAHKILYDTIATDSAQSFAQSVGVTELFDKNGNTSVREIGRLFRSIYTASYLNRAHSQQILQYLQSASYDQLLKYQSSHPIASKYGIDINQGVYNEAGIVYLPQSPYLLAVLIQSKQGSVILEPESKSRSIMQSIRQQITDYITTQIESNNQ
jgi:beta-lactamase class A